MSSGCQKTFSRAIPTRRVTVDDASKMPQDYSTTPGGTLFSTTPGGTRIIYDRKFLMECRNSAVARTPPRYLPSIPGVTSPNTGEDKPQTPSHETNHVDKTAAGDDSLFEMDI
ncbi:eukaryotic translation initiation factor 4E-binding protein 1-like [Acipenser oxyrinchus oxyrinchus]|uniref:Eukaryotic translation initiation factor 4E-binding protein 1-like n=1 Tax=Acipenser oxyrinchus oxyrinchus TaxID=40147 RepID=A0AAD8CPL4_ACIOX|nr:eukaryotic translation initiation factor 4E-binding protein 1-like [Acipenser oxyrinchus oxyrinchus]